MNLLNTWNFCERLPGGQLKRSLTRQAGRPDYWQAGKSAAAIDGLASAADIVQELARSQPPAEQQP